MSPPSPGELLADRVYSWAVGELQYQPQDHTGATHSHSRSTFPAYSGKPKHPEFCPQALKSLCEGPCGPIFEYLVENIRKRPIAHEAQQIQLRQRLDVAHDHHQFMQKQDAKHTEQEEKAIQCQQLALAVAMKKQEITRTKERIKQQRQRQTLQEIYYQQSINRLRVLQQYEPLLQKIETDVITASASSQGHQEDRSVLEDMVSRALGEVQAATRMLLLDGMKLPQSGTSQSISSIYQNLNEKRVDKTQFLDEIEDRKRQMLKQLEQEQFERSKRTSNSAKASALLQTFRSHHNERVAEVESVLSRVESCEQERDQLYTKMREDAQRRLQERKPNGHLQELEETKAHVRGLGAALEFVQGEQLNLVERVVSVEDQSKKLEAMRRTSRNMDQKMAQIQTQVEKLMEMVRLSQRSASDISSGTAGYVADAIGQRLSHLSELIQFQKSTVQADADTIQEATKASQQGTAVRVSTFLPQDLDQILYKERQIGGKVSSTLPLYSSANRSSLSLEQNLLQISSLQQQLAVQTATSVKAHDHTKRMKGAMDSLVSDMEQSIVNLSKNTSMEMLPLASNMTSTGQDEHLTADTLCSAFERDVKATAQVVFNMEAAQKTDFANSIAQTLSQVEELKSIAHDIQSLIADGETISSHLHSKDATHYEQSHASRPGSNLKRSRGSLK
ncbi:hypothetical protein CPB97_011652 [Podila verticillata]|nr:hypothetical protein CPB97_011652 [Podila verticillata]